MLHHYLALDSDCEFLEEYQTRMPVGADFMYLPIICYTIPSVQHILPYKANFIEDLKLFFEAIFFYNFGISFSHISVCQ